MRYLVKAKLKPGKALPLLRAIEEEKLGAGSIAGDEYSHDMAQARQLDDETICWVEGCFCLTPLEEERSYWEEYFELLQIKNAHDRRRCRDLNGTEPWACCDCDCTKRLEGEMEKWGKKFLLALQSTIAENKKA